MRSDRRRERREKRREKKDFSRILSIIYSILLVCFIGLLIWLNVLPAKYLYPLIGVLILASIFIVPVMYSKHGKPERKKIATIVAAFLILVFGVGTYYLGATLNFLGDITSAVGPKETFYVLVKNDSPLQKVDELSQKTVSAHATVDKVYAEARTKLTEDVAVEFEYYTDLQLLVDDIIVGNKEAGFISAASYESINGDDGTIEEKVKILHKVSVPLESDRAAKNVDVTKESFNVLISGIDVAGNIDTISRSDVNMVATINPRTKKVLLTSIPRDYYVKLPSKEAYDKLTHSGLYGTNETVAAVEEALGIEINYYVKVNYSTVIKLVDAIGGIDINSPYSFSTHGMKAQYTFAAGPIHLDGAQALAYSRERKSWADGDMRRNENQQLILEAILKKCTSSSTILSEYTSILNAVKNNIETDMSSKSMRALVKMQLNDMASWDIERYALKGIPDSKFCYALGLNASVVNVDETLVAKALDKILSVQKGEVQADEN